MKPQRASLRPVAGGANDARKPWGMDSGYLLIECLVYISVVFVLLGAGYVAMYRCIDNSLVMRRSTEDIAIALRAGEHWRSDIRQARSQVRVENTPTNQIMRLACPSGAIVYRFETNALCRQVGRGPWAVLLRRVASSQMMPEPRQKLTAWRWELELEPQTKGAAKAGRVRPLFTFLAVPATAAKR